MNIALAGALIASMHRQGVDEYVVCAGARNAPFVKLLVAARGPRVHHFFEERAAAFFALGRARRDCRPVAVVTTSGTAVAELLPAAIEAHYSGVPLVLVSADRPRAYRGSGAPQAIEQAQLFGPYAEAAFDIERVDQIGAVRLAPSAPTHINVAFDEPLLDGEIPALQLEPAAFARDRPPGAAGDATRFAAFVGAVRRPLVIVGGVPGDRRALVLDALCRWQAAVYAEAPSGLRELSDLARYRVHEGAGLTRTTFRSRFDAVIRIGDVPTLRLWRDLDETLADVPVLSIGDRPFSGLARDQASPCSYSVCARDLEGGAFVPASPPQLGAERYRQQLSGLLARFAGSEPGVFRSLSKFVPKGSLVMLGNSLPIREWDLAATDHDRHLAVMGNRGANGIDGLVATFLGLARSDADNWLVVGDLSALYDLSALAFTSAAAAGAALRVVVINNRGGRIFDAMFGDKAFVNQHGFEFSGWAQMFGWSYRLWDAALPDAPALANVVADLPRTPVILELRPDPSAGAGFSAALAALQA